MNGATSSSIKLLSYSGGSFPPVYIPCALFTIKKGEDLQRVLKGIKEAVKEPVATAHAKSGMVSTMEDVEFAGREAFAPAHVGRSCMRML